MINQNEGAERQFIIIYSLRLYKKLVAAGIFPAKQMPNPKDAAFNCWAFPDCEEVRQLLDQSRIATDRKEA